MLAVRQCTLAFLFAAVTGFRRCEELMIDADIILRHPCGGKALLEPLAYLFPVERDDLRQRRDRLIHTVNNGSREAVLDDFRHRAASEGQDWRAAGHGLDHGEPERFRPVDRK